MRFVREDESTKKELMERSELNSLLQQRRKQWRQRNWASTTLPPWRTGCWRLEYLKTKNEKLKLLTYNCLFHFTSIILILN
ncbi:hypothetical protein QQG55_17180 [Brugia pahangi]